MSISTEFPISKLTDVDNIQASDKFLISRGDYNDTENYQSYAIPFSTLNSEISSQVISKVQPEINDLRNGIQFNNNRIDSILSCWPEDASEENTLATKNHVSTYIFDNTGFYWGTYVHISSFPISSEQINIKYNDYVLLLSSENDGYNYTKYVFTKDGWNENCQLSDSMFNEKQWDAINSGLNVDTANNLSNITSPIKIMNVKMTTEGDNQTIVKKILILD